MFVYNSALYKYIYMKIEIFFFFNLIIKAKIHWLSIRGAKNVKIG